MSRRAVRSSRTPRVLAALLVVLAPVQAGTLAGRLRALRTPVAAATAAPSISPSPSPSVVPSPSPSARERRATSRRVAPHTATPDRARVFAGLGAWVDLYDYQDMDPARGVAIARRNGVRTLYLETARYNTSPVIHPAAGTWLVAAHRAGIEVVGWYLPDYANLRSEVARTVAVATWRYHGERFDGVAIDVEEKKNVSGRDEWNRRVAWHAKAVRHRLGTRVPLAVITPTPLGMAVAPQRWAGFPWRDLARASDTLMLMSYWSYRDDCPQNPAHCAYGYTRGNIERTRALAGARTRIHIIGGVADVITPADVADFVRGARDGNASGASLYDLRTTAENFWGLLAPLT